jgi:hypothetical protein
LCLFFVLGGRLLKRIIIFCCLLNISVASAETLSGQNLKLYGRALANYQVCARIAASLGDKTMHSYYAEMFNDSSAEINTYPKSLSYIVIKEFNLSVDKLSKINKQNMGKLCLSRFDSLSRKMQEKKLSAK